MTRTLRVIAVAALAAACENAQAPPPAPVDARLSATSLWAGDTLRVISAGVDASTRVVFDGDTAVSSLENESTMVVLMPLVPGDIDVWVVGDGINPLQDLVRTYGYRSYQASPLYSGVIEPYPGRYSHSFMAVDSGGLVFVTAVNGNRSVFPATVHDIACGRGPGASYDTMAIVLAPAASPATIGACERAQQEFTFSPGPVAGDSGPFVVTLGTRLAARLSPQVWVKGAHHSLCTSGPAAIPCPPINYENATSVRISPRGNRAIALMSGAGGGPPVFDALTGGIAYALPAFVSANGASFSVTGDTLYVVGNAALPSTERLLVAVNAATGTELHRVTLAPRTYYDAMVTSDGRRLVILTSGTSDPVHEGPRLTIYRLPDLTLETVQYVPSAAGCSIPTGTSCTFGRLIGDGAPWLFVVYSSYADYQPNSAVTPSRTFAFEFMP